MFTVPPGQVSHRPPLRWSLPICIATIMIWGVFRLAVFQSFIFPLTFVVPLLLCVWTRSKRMLWSMVTIFVIMIHVKLFWIVPQQITPDAGDWAGYVATLVDLAIGGLAVHFILVLRDRQDFLMASARSANEALAAQFEDLTKTKEALLQTAEDLAKSNKDLEQFAYVASHDLQEPLRQVGGFVDLLERHYSNAFDDRAKEYLGFVAEGTRRMSALINDLLAFSRVGKADMSIQDINIAGTVQDVLKSLRLRLEETNAEITIDALPIVRGNGTALGQLFQNLIGNALKFRGEDRPKIELGCRREDINWLFWVRDNGIGFDQKSADRIFEVFKRLHSRAEYEGTGIGLAICKRVVELHGGHIWAESQPGRGTTFYFTLPAS